MTIRGWQYKLTMCGDDGFESALFYDLGAALEHAGLIVQARDCEVRLQRVPRLPQRY